MIIPLFCNFVFGISASFSILISLWFCVWFLSMLSVLGFLCSLDLSSFCVVGCSEKRSSPVVSSEGSWPSLSALSAFDFLKFLVNANNDVCPFSLLVTDVLLILLVFTFDVDFKDAEDFVCFFLWEPRTATPRLVMFICLLKTKRKYTPNCFHIFAHLFPVNLSMPIPSEKKVSWGP